MPLGKQVFDKAKHDELQLIFHVTGKIPVVPVPGTEQQEAAANRHGSEYSSDDNGDGPGTAQQEAAANRRGSPYSSDDTGDGPIMPCVFSFKPRDNSKGWMLAQSVASSLTYDGLMFMLGENRRVVAKACPVPCWPSA